MKRFFVASLLVCGFYAGMSQTVYVSEGANLGTSQTANGNVGIGDSNPPSKLTVNGNIQMSNASLPMGLMTEVGGYTPLFNMGVNFRSPNRNNTYMGAGFRVDSRSTKPTFQWLYRAAGQTTEKTLMSLDALGDLRLGISDLPVRLSNELGGVTPLFNIEMNFRGSEINTSYMGASFRMDSRSSKPVFQWLYRAPGAPTGWENEKMLMFLNQEGELSMGRINNYVWQYDPIAKVDVALESGKTTATTSKALALTTNDASGQFGLFVDITGASSLGSRYVTLSTGDYNTTKGGKMVLQKDGGSVAIGTSNVPAGYSLAVNGKAMMEEVKVVVEVSTVPDYVFADNYELLSLEETETFIKEHHHLPGVKSAEEMAAEGMELKAMNLLLLQKIEELTLQMIELEKRVSDIATK